MIRRGIITSSLPIALMRISQSVAQYYIPLSLATSVVFFHGASHALTLVNLRGTRNVKLSPTI
jgi:hypothetical protein